MAPNFKVNNVALFQCSPADFELITPVALSLKNVSPPARVAPVTSVAIDGVQSDLYWDDVSESHNGMTVAQGEARNAALARVQARIEARRKVAVQPYEFSATAMEHSLVADANRRSAAVSSTKTQNSDDYWNEIPTRFSGRVSQEVPSDYWVEPASHSEGSTAARFSAKAAAMKRVGEMIRLRERVSAFETTEGGEFSTTFITPQVPCLTAVGGGSYWDC